MVGALGGTGGERTGSAARQMIKHGDSVVTGSRRGNTRIGQRSAAHRATIAGRTRRAVSGRRLRREPGTASLQDGARAREDDQATAVQRSAAAPATTQ